MQPTLLHVELARATRRAAERARVPEPGPPPGAPPGRLRRSAARVLAAAALRVDGDAALRILVR